MADFQTSTHRARWIFSPGDLREKRHFTNQRAINTLEKYGAMRVEVDVDGSLSYPDPSVGAQENALGRKSLPKPLTVEEEQLMCVFYENKIQEVCGAFRFPHKIQATAIIYFKRFYLQWSIMEHHPKHVMLTCIYASCKIEENHVSAEELGKGIQQDHQVILNNEMIVFQSLGFDLIVYAPYRSIEGFVDDMEASIFLARDGDTPKLKDLCDTAKIVADKIMLTDAPLLYPPGQLALASRRKANLLQTVIDFERYLDDLFLRKHFSHSIADLVKFLDSIDDLVDMLKIPTAKDMRHIDRKLKYCWDPSSQEEARKERRNPNTDLIRDP